MPALTYIVRPGEANDELRYSLRSVAAHWTDVGQVTIVGHAPHWLDRDRIRFVPGNQWKHKKQPNVYNNVLIACTHKGHAEDLVLMNDDFFVLKPITGPNPMAYRSTLDAHIGSIRSDSWWRRSLVTTAAWLRQQHVEEPLLSYELHQPFPVHAADMAAVLTAARQVTPANPPQWRTLYGNYFGVPAEPAADFKVKGYADPHPLPDTPFFSTDDATWLKATIAAELRERFPCPSIYERRGL